MKKITISIFCFLVLIVLFLYITTKTSTAYAIGRQGILTSPEIAKSVGAVEQVFLTMFSEKTGPTGKGCATLMYFVSGTGDSEWVQVRLQNGGHSSEWKVVEMIEGYRGSYKVHCVYG